jgi:hypothetical protein
VFHSANAGGTWTVKDTPVVHGAASQGIFSVAFKDALHGVVAGGDYSHPDQGGNNLATTDNGGESWKLIPISPERYFSAIAYMTARNPGFAAVGSAASGVSGDELHTWTWFGPDAFNAVESNSGVTYAVGSDGKIGVLKP